MSDKLSIEQLRGCTTVNVLTYVVGMGVNIRCASAPPVPGDDVETSIWMFQYIDPNRPEDCCFAVDQGAELAQAFLADPRMLKLYSMEPYTTAALTPFTPTSDQGDAVLAVKEFNQWLRRCMAHMFDQEPEEQIDFNNIPDQLKDLLAGLEGLLNNDGESQ